MHHKKTIINQLIQHIETDNLMLLLVSRGAGVVWEIVVWGGKRLGGLEIGEIYAFLAGTSLFLFIPR